MSVQNLAHLLLEYRYWILIPLSILEGPIVAFVAGTLAAAGYFNIFYLGIYFFARDMVMDTVFYVFGYFGKNISFVQRILKRFNIDKSELDKVRAVWELHPARTMYIGKLSYGISAMFIAVAGTVHMRLKKFYSYGALVAITQYWSLLAFGYFFGHSFGGRASDIVEFLQYLLAGISFFLAIYYAFHWYLQKYKHHIIKK